MEIRWTRRVDIRERERSIRATFASIISVRHRLTQAAGPELSRGFSSRHVRQPSCSDPQRDLASSSSSFASPPRRIPAWQLEVVAGIIDKDEPAAAVARRKARRKGFVIGESLILRPAREFDRDRRSLLRPRRCGDAGGIPRLADEPSGRRQAPTRPSPYSRREIQNAFTLIALHWFAAKRETLRRQWR